jgi:hypothetical protein
VEAQFVQDVLDVVGRRTFGDDQGFGDLTIAETPGDQPGDLSFARSASASAASAGLPA